MKIDRLHALEASRRCRSRSSGIITGLAGQVGSGTSTVLRALGGLVPEATGTIEVRGRRVLLNTPRRAADAGVLYLPNDRQREGLFLGQSVERNLTATRLRRLSRVGVLLRRRIQRVARELATMTGVPLDRLGSPRRHAQRGQSAEGAPRPGARVGGDVVAQLSTSRRAASTSVGGPRSTGLSVRPRATGPP